jgi:hypothetical protein
MTKLKKLRNSLKWTLVIICSFQLNLTFGQVKNNKLEPFTWPIYVNRNSWALKDTIPKSNEIKNIQFTGRYANYTDADTWYPTWAGNDTLYSPYTDGMVDGIGAGSWAGPKATTGLAKISGNDPLDLEVSSLGTKLGSAVPYEGRYPAGLLVYNDVMYYGTYCVLKNYLQGMNWSILGPFVGFDISYDYGKTWVQEMNPANNLFNEYTDYSAKPIKIGAPHFVDFGKNMEHSPDGKAYLVAQGASVNDDDPRPGNLSWCSADQIYLIRVVPTPENINDKTKYEYFSGYDNDNKPTWTQDFEKIVPIFEWNNHAGIVTMTYNPGLDKYLMCITDGWPTNKSMDTYILESDNLHGPWATVTYMKDFGPQAYFVNIPSKFISDDGKTAWLCYSANYINTNFKDSRDPGPYTGNPEGSLYTMSLHEIIFLTK